YGDHVLEVDRVGLRDGATLISIARIIKFVSQVRKRKYDFVIDLHSLSETNLLGFLSGAPRRLYARRPGRSIDALGNFNPRPPRAAKIAHAVDLYFDETKPLGIVTPPRLPVLKTTPAADQSVETLL